MRPAYPDLDLNVNLARFKPRRVAARPSSA
jgi:hypothetical protein